MANEDKTSNFLKAIDKYAKEQQKEIKLTAASFKRKELQKAEAEVLRDSYILIQKEMAQMRKSIDSEVSKAEIQSKRELLKQRKELMEKVFLKAKEKLISYTKTQEYENLLKKSSQKISDMLDSTGTTLFVKKEDLNFKDEILAFFEKKCTVKEKNDIKIGGILGVNEKLGLIIDETLDSKLENERNWFSENSGLSIV